MKKKYSLGTGDTGIVRSYIQTPEEVLQENMANIARAKSEAQSNPISNILNVLGNVGMQAAGSASPASGLGVGALQLLGNILANGGVVTNENVEVEGGEVFQIPSGSVGEFKGNSHENGGIDVSLPIGTTIFSERIKRNGKTMAKRKSDRTKYLDKIDKLLEKSNTDKLLKNTKDRSGDIAINEEQEDLDIQNIINNIDSIMNLSENKKAANGLGMLSLLGNLLGGNPLVDKATENVKAPVLNEVLPTADVLSTNVLPGERQVQDNSIFNNILGNIGDQLGNLEKPTGGDILGLFGNLYGGYAPLKNTLQNRATDTPNINAFEDFGKDALEANDKSKQYVAGQRDNALNNLQLSSNAAKRRSRNSARSVNVMRATDLATDMETNKAQRDIYDTFARQMMDILSRESQLQNIQDQAVMQGEQNRDLAYRRDKDNFYTQKGKDLANISKMLQQTGKDVNAIAERGIIKDLLAQLSKYGKFDKNFNIVSKD